ncbi:MAG: hypothetical protein JJV98_17285 [Desulfosarcina sp.]|nr:hypothetical protein [Desulfobacterales bacterium]
MNISSGAALKAIPGWSAYCVAKSALTHDGRGTRRSVVGRY